MVFPCVVGSQLSTDGYDGRARRVTFGPFYVPDLKKNALFYIFLV